jgi:phosphatidylserine/phosphatidylglycerophosphate/cardiolipin synthase-like enzyme
MINSRIILLVTALTTTAVPLMAAEVVTYLGSEGSVRDFYVNAIYDAEYEIKVAMDRFTDYALAEALIHAAKYGREVYVIVDGDRENVLKGAAISDYLSDGGVEVMLNKTEFRLFDRFAIIDETMVIVGGYPFVEDAGDSPMNDLVAIEDPDVAAVYADHFDYLWNLTK